VRYDWDLDDDDLFEIYDGSADIEHWFNKPGYYDVTVRVTDDDGAQDVASLQVTARGWWHHTFTDSDPDDRISMIVVNGNPAIACEIDESPNGTQYFRATDNMGFGWNDPIKPAANSRYNWVVMKIVSGNPALVYKGDSASVPGETTWHFVRAADADGSTWGTPVEISTDTDLYSPSMAIVDGNPAVVFQWDDWPDCELQYFRATDANGSAWGSAVVVVASTDSQSIYDGNALMVADGNPAIIYRDDTNDDVRYVRATDTAGSTWGAPLPIITEDDPSDDIRRLFPGIVAGNPATVYEYRDDSSTDEVKEDICYIRATDAAGSTWGTPVTVAANWDISDTGNLAIINGYPAFCFEADDYDAPAYCRALDATGSSWGPIELVDGWWTNYDDTCLAEVDGHPAVAYQRTINNNSRHGYLKYAIKIE